MDLRGRMPLQRSQESALQQCGVGRPPAHSQNRNAYRQGSRRYEIATSWLGPKTRGAGLRVRWKTRR